MLETAVSFGQLLWGTLVLRPYVFIFLSVYLWLATWHLGLGRTLIYLLCGYSSGLAVGILLHSHRFSLWGLYLYSGHPGPGTLGPGGAFHGLTVVCLPLLRQLQSGLAAAAGPASGQGGAERSRARKICRATVMLAAVLFVTLDIIIDPLALRGYRWFLGQIYGYPEPGIYFGIPLSNFAGWLLVGIIMIALLQRLERWSPPVAWLAWGQRRFAGAAYLGAGLYAGGAAVQPEPDLLYRRDAPGSGRGLYLPAAGDSGRGLLVWGSYRRDWRPE